MTKTILITGTSSGFGEAAALRFAHDGWNVAATMRDITKAKALQGLPNVAVLRLDVEDAASIQTAISAAIDRFGRIDVVVNNAGYGQFGIFEAASREMIQRQFDVNLFGAMDVTRALLPHFRANRAGVIVNISSGAGAIGFPMASIYSASKFALEGWSESLAYELAPLGIRVKVIEPGAAMGTSFSDRMGAGFADLSQIDDYGPFIQQITQTYDGFRHGADTEAVEKVVAAILESSTDNTNRLRYAPTADIYPLLSARRETSEESYHDLMQQIFAG